MPFAPTRYSTITCCFKRSVNCCATSRQITSLPPPGAKIEMMRTGFVGYVDCAEAGGTVVATRAAAIPIRKHAYMLGSRRKKLFNSLSALGGRGRWTQLHHRAHEPAIDPHRRAGDVARFARGKKSDEIGQLER